MKYLMFVCIDPNYEPGPNDVNNAPDIDDWGKEMAWGGMIELRPFWEDDED